MTARSPHGIRRFTLSTLGVIAIVTACNGTAATPTAVPATAQPTQAAAATATAVAATPVVTAATTAAPTVAPTAAPTVATTVAPAATPAAQTEITVVSLIPGSEPSAFDAFNAQVAQFEAKFPNIKVTSQEYEWTGPTFAAMLAGGTLPDVFTIPFTDGKSLIEQKQLADISAQVAALPYATKFNPNVLDAGQDASGKIYAVPTQAYGVGLHYNRTLFTAAGLDPNKPPTTWDEVRADAKTIADKTGVAGYSEMTQSNTGGWMLTTFTYALGGRMETGTGTSTVVTVNNPATKLALQKLHDMRWTDNSMGSNFLLDWSTINQAFAAGQMGMYMGGSDVYTSLLRTNNINPADYGLAAMPLANDPNAGILGGGTLAAVNIKATDAQKDAAVKWIDFYYMNKLTTQDGAVLDAKTLTAADQPVGVPALPIFDKASLDQYNQWIASYVNVPLDQMSSFTSGVFQQSLIAEPSTHTQELYATLDSVVQAVLTDQNADIDGLLAKANSDIQTIVSKP